jgi:hypothetical protein
MKHQTLRIAASLLAVVAWVIGVAEAVVAVLIGIGAATVLAKIGFVLGGFIISAFSVIMMLAVSKLIYLFIDIEEDLAKIARSAGESRGD